MCAKKRNHGVTLAQQKSPVKVKKYKYSYKYGKKDIVVHKDTVFTPTTETPSFPYINQEQVLSIASLTGVAADQLINIKGLLAKRKRKRKKMIVPLNELNISIIY